MQCGEGTRSEREPRPVLRVVKDLPPILFVSYCSGRGRTSDPDVDPSKFSPCPLSYSQSQSARGFQLNRCTPVLRLPDFVSDAVRVPFLSASSARARCELGVWASVLLRPACAAFLVVSTFSKFPRTAMISLSIKPQVGSID